MNKDTHIISEHNCISAESNNTEAIQGIMNLMSHITLNHRQMDFAKAANCKFTANHVIELMARYQSLKYILTFDIYLSRFVLCGCLI